MSRNCLSKSYLNTSTDDKRRQLFCDWQDKGYNVRYWQSEFFLSVQALAHFKVCESVYDLINGVFTMHFVVPGSHIRRAIFHFFLSHHCNTKKQVSKVYSI